MSPQWDDQQRVVVVDRHTYGWRLLQQAPPAVRAVAVLGYLLALAGIGLLGYGVVTSIVADTAPGEDLPIVGIDVLGVPLIAAAFATFFVGFVLVAAAGLVAALRQRRR